MKAVLFDLDETLLDRTASLRDFVVWQAQGMLRNSISDPQAFVQRFIELDNHGKVWKDKVYESLIEEFAIQGWSVDELLQVYILCFSAFSKPKKGAIEAVITLKEQGYKLGLVSNGKTPFQERNFNALGISDLFDAIIVSEAVNYRKPDIEIFELACQRLGVLTAESVFVGDNPVADIGGACSCGMFTVFIPSALHQTCDQAHAVCENFSSLASIVNKAGDMSSSW